ncbi:MAG: hypothetical protein ACRDHZ_01440 [Ktedonobacteraceae bacterium]
MTPTGKDTPLACGPGALLLGPSVAGHTVQRDENHHAFVIDQTLLPCTPTEYRVLALLLAQVDRCVPYAQLIACAQETPTRDAVLLKQARTRLMHLMSDLRAKIWVFGWDIVAVMQTGYILLSSRTEEPVAVEKHG